MDFVEPARAFTLELVGGRGHYERVVRAAMEAKRSVWIATANLKELMVEDHRAVPGRRRTARLGSRGGARAPTGLSSKCSTSWRGAGSSCGSFTPARRRARFGRRSPRAAPRAGAGAARLPARPLQDGHRRRRVRLRRQRQLDGRGSRRQGGRATQLRARLRRRRRRPARPRAGDARPDLARRRLQGLQAARALPGPARRPTSVDTREGGRALTTPRARTHAATPGSADLFAGGRRNPPRVPDLSPPCGQNGRAYLRTLWRHGR